MTIGKKITALSVLLVALTILLGAVALSNVSSMSETSKLVSLDSLPGLYHTGRIGTLQAQMQVLILTYIGASDAKQMAAVEARISEVDKQFNGAMKEYESTIQLAIDREMWTKANAAYESMMAGWGKVREISRQGQITKAFKLFGQEVEPKSILLSVSVNDLIELNRNQSNEYAASAAKTAAAARLWIGAILLISVLAAGLLAFLFIRSTTALLKSVVTQLSEGAEHVSGAAHQIASSAQSVAQGTSEQAASLEETSSAATEMSSMTQRNAEHSKESAALVAQVDSNIGEANLTLGEMVESMKEIGQSSDKISKIIRVIDEIAFQTNILALNAAVEAARAGEAGLGFAVVADEVRNLAHRSAQAAKDTGSLIEESIVRASEGSAKLDKVAAAIRSITESAARVRILVDEVNFGSQEQATGVNQISMNIVKMQRVTQQSAAQAEESAAAGEELSSQAESMKSSVQRLSSLVIADQHARRHGKER